MRVLINLTASRPGTSGEVFAVEWMRAAAALRTRHEFCLAVTGDNRSMADRFPKDVQVVELDLPTSRVLRSLAVQRALPAAVRQHRIDILLQRGNFVVRTPGCRQISMLENANAVSHPSIQWPLAMRLRNGLMGRMTRQAMRRADHLLFPSANAAQGFLARCSTSVPWSVVPHGCRPSPAAPRPAEAPARYILAVTSVLPHKNLERLVQAFARLVATTGYPGSLEMVGYAASDSALRHLRSLVPAREVAARLHLAPAVAPEALAGWYQHADLLAIPSLEETFGLPALEAMQAGCPAVVSDLVGRDPVRPFFSPFREICEDAAEYCDPFSEQSIADAMGRALAPDRAAALRTAGQLRAAQYSWSNTAALLEAVIDGV